MTDFRTRKDKRVYPVNSKTKKYDDDNNQLYGHTSPETAYVVDNYPYGGYRTKMRYWIEHSKRNGDRFCRQSLNPKTDKWNKPKKSTYSGVMVMTLDEKGHVTTESLHYGDKEPKIQLFMDNYKLTKEQEQIAKYFIAADRATQHYKWEIKPSTGDKSYEEYQKEQKKARETIRKLESYEREMMDD